jgi:hypothetical protein
VGRFPAARCVKQILYPKSVIPASGNPGLFGTGPPIKTFGGDAFKTNLIAASDTPKLAAGLFIMRINLSLHAAVVALIPHLLLLISSLSARIMLKL